MSDLQKALPHLIMAAIVIGAVVAMAIANRITGAEALPVIIGVGGFTLGGTVASGSTSSAITAVGQVSGSVSQEPTQPTQQPEQPPTSLQAASIA